MNEPHCSDPIDATTLADYWLGVLSPDDEDSLEEHLFRCDECGQRLQEVIALAEGIRKLAREGALRLVVSDSFLERATREGLRVRQYSPPAGGRVDCTVTADDDLLVARLAADLSGARRVDLSLCDETGMERERLHDIPFHAAQREVVFNEPIEKARAAPANVLLVKLVAVDEQGDRVLGQYTFNHTPQPGRLS